MVGVLLLKVEIYGEKDGKGMIEITLISRKII
jgi:hypothetical protein